MTIRGNYRTAMFHLIDMKCILLAHRAKPDVFMGIFPVGFCSTSFLSFPSNTISNVKILLSDFHDRQGGFPVSAEIDRGRWFEYGQVGLNDIVQPLGIILLGSSFKSQRPKRLRQIVGGIQN